MRLRYRQVPFLYNIYLNREEDPSSSRIDPSLHKKQYEKYRARRFVIIYAVDHKTQVIRQMAVGHRRSVYEELTEQLRHKKRE